MLPPDPPLSFSARRTSVRSYRPDRARWAGGATLSPQPDTAQQAEATGRRYAVLYHRRRLTNALALGLADAAALSTAMLLAGGVRWWLLGSPMIPAWSALLLPAWVLGAWAACLLPDWGLGPVETLRRTMTLLGLAFVGVAVVLFLSKQSDEVSRLTWTLAFALSVPLVPYSRTLVKKMLVRRHRWGLPAAIYGAGPAAEQVIEALKLEAGIGYNPIAAFDDDPFLWGETVAGVPILGSTDRCTHEAPVALLVGAGLDRAQMQARLDGPLAHYKQVVIIPDLFEGPSLWVRSRDIGGVLGLEVTRNLLDPLPRLSKRLIDMSLVVLALPFWLPLCGLIALAVRLEDGSPVLFHQTRLGRHGLPFQTLKFRTMVQDAEHELQEALGRDPTLRAEWNVHLKLRKDPRITRVGRFLRRSSLDELPQLFNVLRGEMALVGPRPLPAYHHDLLSPRTQQLRTRLRPGLTGLWQVSGRSDIGNEGLERWDTYYIRNWSVWLDVVILVRTFRVLLRQTGAY